MIYISFNISVTYFVLMINHYLYIPILMAISELFSFKPFPPRNCNNLALHYVCVCKVFPRFQKSY